MSEQQNGSTNSTTTTIIRPQFIPDGYTRKHTFEPSGITVEYRPLIGHPFARHIDKLSTCKDNDSTLKQSAEMLAKQLVSWNLRDIEDNPVPITTEVIARIEPREFLNDLQMLVCGIKNDPLTLAESTREAMEKAEADAKN